MNQRQQKAADLTREIQKMGAAVINPMPLADGCRLRFRVLSGAQSETLVQTLREWEWDPTYVTSGPEFRPDGTTQMSNLYEIDIPTPRTAVPSDRIPNYELAGKEKPSAETQAMLDEWLGKKRQRR
jgi:hypothetical protein